jgi:hypothetical protein
MSDSTEIGLEPTPQPPARSRGKAIGLGIGALAVVAGGAFAAFSLSSSDSGSPEDPVRELLAALDEGDVLGALEQLEPGERDAMRDPMIDLVDALNRLEILEGASLDQLEGIDVGFTDVELSSEEVTDGIAHVRIEGGNASYDFDPAELPLGDFVTQFLDPADLEATSDEDPLEAEDDYVTTVERDGEWYVSIGYTIAEAAREEAGMSFEDMGEGIEADGADSPEGAIEEMLEAIESKDLERGLALLAPGEMGALHRYAGLYLDEAPDYGEVEIEIGEPELEVVGDGSRRKVLVSIPSFRAVDEGASATYEDGCITIEDESMPEPQEVCTGDDPFAALGEAGLPIDMFGIPELPELSVVNDPPDFGVIVTEVDGEWYVSPVGTALTALSDTLGAMERADLDAIVAWVGELQEAFMRAASEFESSFEESFSESFGEDFGEEFETTPTTTG